MDARRVSPAAETADREIVIARTFDVPRDLMFKVWTDPEHMQRWWGPKGFKMFHSKMDLRPGGSYHYGMHSPDGHDMWGKFVFREIVKPERLVYVNSFADEKGNVARHPMHLAWPLEMLSTITFTEQAGKTTVTVRFSPLNATAEERKTFEDGFDSMRQGWGGTFDQLGDYLAKALRREVVITRVFDAPRGLVWKAWTDPQHMAQWWGPNGFTNPVCEMDVRPGGAMRIHMRAPDGVEYPMTGVFREIKEPERLVFTAIAVDEKGNHLLESLTTVTFTEHGGKTKLTVQASAIGLADVAAQMLEGMEAGWTQSLERLEALVAKK